MGDLGVHSCSLRTRLSKGLFPMALNFPRECYSRNIYIAGGGKVYRNFLRQRRATINIAYPDYSIVLTTS